MMRRWLAALLAIGLAGALLAGWLASGPRGVVDWRRARVVVFESDDWGLCGFVPDTGALAGLDRGILASGRLPAAYWGTTLEDSATVARLAALLAGHAGRDGLPAVLQANYILSSLEYRPAARGEGEAGAWLRHDLPSLPEAYARPGLWRAVAAARAEGVWRAELHGAFHYDPERRREAVAADALARRAAARGVLPFPGSERAWELGPWRGAQVLAEELDRSLGVFRRLFGRPPVSVMAPDYVWDGACEARWAERGLRVIQGKREQRHPGRRGGRPGERLRKVAARAWSRASHPERVYLERNCRFEPVQEADPQAVAARCLQEIRRAWQRGEPAIVETHRLNFVQLDPELRERGLRALAALLDGLDDLGGVRYLTDQELAQLVRGGTSWSVRGNSLVARNLTRSRRLLPVSAGPPAADPEVAAAVVALRTAGIRLPDLVLLPPGATLRLALPAPAQSPAATAPPLPESRRN